MMRLKIPAFLIGLSLLTLAAAPTSAATCLTGGRLFNEAEIIWSQHHKAHLYCAGDNEWRYLAQWGRTGTNDLVFMDGKVGIGTNAPESTLHVSGDVRGNTIRLAMPNGGNHIVSHSNAIALNIAQTGPLSKGGFYFRTNPVAGEYASSSYTDLMRITSDGNVGIGTSTPQSNLHIVSSGNPSNLMLGELNTGTEISAVPIENAQLILSGIHNQGYNGHGVPLAVKLWIGSYDNDGTTVYPIYVEDENNSPDFWIRNKPSASGISTAYFQGNVGIGTMSPSHRLHVNGIARSTQASFATSSDLRVKEDIEPLAEGLDTVMRLNPVNFHYKHDYAEGKQGMDGLKRGFIAQEVEAVVPEMVTQTEEVIADGSTIDDFRILNNGDFTPILVKAVQELKAENDALRAELQAANDNFRRELDELKAAIGK